MDAQNYCSTAVTTHELYGVLRKHYNGQWYAMASRYKSGGLPGKTLYVEVVPLAVELRGGDPVSELSQAGVAATSGAAVAVVV